MQKIALILILIFCLSSCKSRKSTISKSDRTKTESIKNSNNVSSNESSAIANKIIDYAKKFDGVKYKYGGDTKKGMDCSGLVTTSFKSENILLPRSTSELVLSGDWIDIKHVQRGDLLFFATSKNNRKVNHVAIVTDAKADYVEFIHATTSAGVIVSNLAERYWYFAFVQARRIL